ncbi:MAG TPA: hypothetical protein VKR58_08330, partial [Aquella sp.]|nr:hypothetical protein [Aquella sp.]
NGNDTIPFFYPFSETDNQTPQPYYITVVDSNLQLQFTRANFPYITNGMVPGTQTSTLQNYIINNNFWRNIGTLNAQNVTQQIVCPSQHDGYTNGDIQFIKSVTGATETITFTKFGLGVTPLIGDITPEYYINHNCTALQGGETQKCYQFPISLHVKTLESQQATVTIQAQSVGSGANNISLYIYQFTGTGTSSPAPILIQELTLTNNWQKFTIPFTFPSAAGATLGNGGDDALFLQVQMPLSATFDINFCLPSLYLGSTVPTDNFSTYDQDNSIISSSRTGDVRASMNSFYYFGWVPMNNGTLGNPSSNATARANVDSWPLFNLLWGYAKAYDSGSNNNPICQMYTSAGSNTNFGGSAISDFNANNQLALTQMFGQVLMGTVPISALLSSETSAITASNSGGNILITPTTTISLLYVGMPVTFTTTGSLPGNIVANAIYYVCNISGGTFNISTSFSNALSGTVVAFSSAGSNSTV